MKMCLDTKAALFSLLKLLWLFICVGLMLWQLVRCTQKFIKNPTVTSTKFEKWSDKVLPEIVVCPNTRAKKHEITKHGLDLKSYLFGEPSFQWISQTGNQTPEEVLEDVTWDLEELVFDFQWKEVGEDWHRPSFKDI